MARRKSAASSTEKVEAGGAAPEAAVEQASAPAATDVQDAVQEAVQDEPQATGGDQAELGAAPAADKPAIEPASEEVDAADAKVVGGSEAPAPEVQAVVAAAAELEGSSEPAAEVPAADGEAVSEASEDAESEPAPEFDAMAVWLNTTVFPVQITLRNHGSMPKVEPISGAYLDAGGVASVTLHNPEHAVSVLDNLSALNDDDTSATRGLVADELPFALTKKG